MKVNIIKGPQFEEYRERAYELLYQIIKRKVISGVFEKEFGKDPVNLIKDEKS